MTIGIFTDTFFPEINGVATSVMLLRRELEKLGHTVYVITCSHPSLRHKPDIGHTYRLPSAPFIFLPSRRCAVIYSRSVAHQMGALNLDIVHTNTEFSIGMFGKLIAAALDRPVVHTYHTLYEDYVHYITKGRLPEVSTEMARRFSRVFCNSCTTVVTPTEKMRDLLLDYEVTKPISVIPTGVDISQFKQAPGDAERVAALRARLGIGPRDKVILYVGRLAKEKSVDCIVRRLPALFRSYPDAKFLLVGKGPWRPEIEAIAAAAGIRDRLIFAGECPWSEVPLYYKLGDVFISASLSETQGLTFIEAMASGIPVLAKKDRSVEKLVLDGYSGGLFSDDAEIPAKLERILRDGAYREHTVANALKLAEQNSSEQFAKSVERLYRNTLHAWDTPGRKRDLGKKVMQKVLL